MISIRFVAACIVAMITQSAAAHHAFSANYDINNRGSIQGVVEEVQWTNPHIHFYIRVTGEDGTDQLWDVEWMHLKGMKQRRNFHEVGSRRSD